MKEHDELAVYDRAELEALRDLHSRSRNLAKRSRQRAMAAGSFTLSGAALMLAIGGGPLGVLFVGGLIGGVYFLFGDE